MTWVTNRPKPIWRRTPHDPLMPRRWPSIVVFLFGLVGGLGLWVIPTSYNRYQNRQEAQIKKVWIADGKQGNEKGALIHTAFNTQNLQGKLCRILVFFYDEQGQPIKTSIPEFTTTSNTLYVGDDFTPRYQSTRFDDYPLFLPYRAFSELSAGKASGNVNIRFFVVILRKEDGEVELTQSEWEICSYKWWRVSSER